MNVQKTLQDPDFSSFWYTARVELLDHMVIPFWIFWRTAILFSTAAAPFYMPTNIAQGFHILASTCWVVVPLLVMITFRVQGACPEVLYQLLTNGWTSIDDLVQVPLIMQGLINDDFLILSFYLHVLEEIIL